MYGFKVVCILLYKTHCVIDRKIVHTKYKKYFLGGGDLGRVYTFLIYDCKYVQIINNHKI